jgi:hypothetical protein
MEGGHGEVIESMMIGHGTNSAEELQGTKTWMGLPIETPLATDYRAKGEAVGAGGQGVLRNYS